MMKLSILSRRNTPNFLRYGAISPLKEAWEFSARISSTLKLTLTLECDHLSTLPVLKLSDGRVLPMSSDRVRIYKTSHREMIKDGQKASDRGSNPPKHPEDVHPRPGPCNDRGRPFRR